MIRGVTHAFHGFAFEILIQKRDFRMISLSFVAGVQKKVYVDLYYKEGPVEGSAAWKRLGDFEGNVAQGILVPIQLTQGIAMGGGVHSLCLYSPSANNAVSVCPRKEAVRQCQAFQLGTSYNIEDGKGNLSRKGKADESDFCGELMVSFT